MEPQEIINYLKKLEEKARMADRNRSLAGEASRQFVRAYQLKDDEFKEKERKHDFFISMLDELQDDLTDLRKGIRRLSDELRGKGNWAL